MINSPAAAAPPRSRWRILRRLPRLIWNAFAVVGLLCVIYTVCFDLSIIVSPSMSPTLRGTSRDNGDWLLSEKITYWFRGPRRWEVVRFHNSEGILVSKRVVGLPGEKVAIRNDRVFINGSPVSPPLSLSHLHYYAYGKLRGGQEMACGDGYFLLGDDSKDSQDSRYDGPLDPSRLRGRSWLIVWPPSRMGFVNP